MLPRARSLDCHKMGFFRRCATGLFSQAGMFQRAGQTSQSRYVGATQDLNIGWHVDRHTTAQFLAAYFEVGSYLRETQPPAKNTTYFSVIASYKF